jgi:hypothetical protein
MKFRVEHAFSGTSLKAFETLFFDEPFNIALCAALKLSRTLVSREEKNGTLRRVTQVAAQRDIPAAVAKVLGSNRIEYLETLEYPMGSNRGTWKTVSSLLSDKVDSAGSFSFAANGSQIVRVVDGYVKVKIFGLGTVIERFIVADIEQGYEQAAQFMQDYIRRPAPVA